MIVEALARLDSLVPAPQPETGVSYAAKIDKAETRVDWGQPAEMVDRQIRGLSPVPGAWCMAAGERVKLLCSEPRTGQGVPGEILDDALTVACGRGAVRILRLQRAGRGAQDAAEVLRGMALPQGMRLG